ncbi:MAG: helix-turn-helix domain-containing protein [Christensenellales bacterium]
MTRKQLKRHTVITQVIDGLITREKAAELLELSVRQIDRIKKSYLQEGVESLSTLEKWIAQDLFRLTENPLRSLTRDSRSFQEKLMFPC